MSANETHPAGVGSELIAASKTSVSHSPTRQEARRDESALTFEDREAARVAGYEAGLNHKFGLEVEDQILARLQARTLEALGMAKRSARHGEAFSAMVIESGERQ